MLLDKNKVRATHKMLLKHKIREGAREMNIVPGLHSTLVSVPKMVDEDYIVVFDKKSAKTYDATTTTISATEQPVLKAPRCTSTGLWLMPLDADGEKENDGHHYKAKVSLGAKRVSRQEVSSVALNSHKISYD
jgi:hypothetical protein